MVTTQLLVIFVSSTCSLFAILLMGLLHYSDHPHKRNLIFTFRLSPHFEYLKWVDSSQQKFFDQKELTYLAFKIISLKFLKCSFFYVGDIIQGFPYFCEASAASFAEPMQIAQDKRNVYQFLKYTVREDSRINFVTRYVPWIFSQTLNLSTKKCPGVWILKNNVFKNFNIFM